MAAVPVRFGRAGRATLPPYAALIADMPILSTRFSMFQTCQPMRRTQRFSNLSADMTPNSGVLVRANPNLFRSRLVNPAISFARHRANRSSTPYCRHGAGILHGPIPPRGAAETLARRPDARCYEIVGRRQPLLHVAYVFLAEKPQVS